LLVRRRDEAWSVERESVERAKRMNSREKGKRGERQWRDELRANGYAARRGQQFSGSAESPDVVCEELGWIHFEVKAVERLNIEEAMEQARRDCAGGKWQMADGKDGNRKVAVVAHRRSRRPWLVTMDAETFFRVIRGDFTEGSKGNEGDRTERTDGTKSRWRMAKNFRFEISDFKGRVGAREQQETKQQQ
jgi:hypothetical protein